MMAKKAYNTKVRSSFIIDGWPSNVSVEYIREISNSAEDTNIEEQVRVSVSKPEYETYVLYQFACNNGDYKNMQRSSMLAIGNALTDEANFDNNYPKKISKDLVDLLRDQLPEHVRKLINQKAEYVNYLM